MTTLPGDVRQTLRSLRKSPGLASAAVLTFALGVGANAAIFSVVNAVLLRPLGYHDPSRLMVLEHGGMHPVAPATYLDWRKQARSFTDIAAAQKWGVSLRTESRPESISGLQVTANLFPLLGAGAVAGRVFSAEEDRPGHTPVVVIAYSLWQREFGGRADVVGRQLVIDGDSYTVAGVMPAGFRFAPFWVTDAEIWTPFVMGTRETDRNGQSLRVFGRLRPGVSRQQAQSEMDIIMQRLAETYPDSSAKLTVAVTPLRDRTVGKVRPMLLMLLGTVGFVLLVACLNVASLMLARASARRREIAIRLAIGASRRQIARRAMVEGAILSGLGGLCGLWLAWAGVEVIRGLLPEGAMPRQEELGLDSVVIGFTALLSLVCGVLAGLIPAWQSSHADVNEALKQGGRSGTAARGTLRARSLLITGEMALAFLLLTGGGLLLHSFARLLSLDPGFQPEHLLTMEVSVAGTNETAAPRRAQFYREVIDRIGALPGVQGVSAINHVPISGDVWGTSFRVDGQPVPKPGEFPNAVYRVVEPGYFSVMQTPILQGRDFTAHDQLAAPRVVMVNQSTARRHWPNGDALGQRIVCGRPGEGMIPLTIVGIVHDVKQADWQAVPDEEIYFPFLQSRDYLEDPGLHVAAMSMVVRTAGDPAAMAGSVENVVHSLDRGVLVSGVTSMEQAIARSLWRQRLSLLLLGVFAGVALMLALTGMYGVVSHSIEQRTQELGIRMALGADGGNILWLAVRQGMAPVLAGSGIGLCLALGSGRMIGAMLFEVKPADPLTLAGVAVLLSLAGLLANWGPARRASRVDPLEALREE